MRSITEYECGVCERRFKHAYNAANCETQGFNPKFKAGDVVVRVHPAYTWWDGKKYGPSREEEEPGSPWVMPRGMVGSRDIVFPYSPLLQYGFFYVVTHVDAHGQDNRIFDDDTPVRWGRHVARYHVATKATAQERGCVTDGGIPFRKVVNGVPKEVLVAAKKMVGTKFENYL